MKTQHDYLKEKQRKSTMDLPNIPPSHVVPLLYSLSVCFSLFISLFFLNTLPFIQSVCVRESRHAESIWRVMSSDRKSFVWRLPRRFMAIYALLLHTHTHTQAVTVNTHHTHPVALRDFMMSFPFFSLSRQSQSCHMYSSSAQPYRWFHHNPTMLP